VITYASLDTPIGKLLIAKTSLGVCKISLQSENDSTFFQWILDIFPKEEMVENSNALQDELNELREYFDGVRENFTFPIDLRTTQFQEKALKKVAEIPFGKTASYKEIAERMNNAKAVRAVGSANGRNPVPIVIPCHRVIAHDGTLGGFGGGLPMKKWLLKHERSPLSHSD
tara:strand:- start:12874 stop:13386 length:513 start_codon:yes stop_codon:yes gene_type:complete